MTAREAPPETVTLRWCPECQTDSRATRWWVHDATDPNDPRCNGKTVLLTYDLRRPSDGVTEEALATLDEARAEGEAARTAEIVAWLRERDYRRLGYVNEKAADAIVAHFTEQAANDVE